MSCTNSVSFCAIGASSSYLQDGLHHRGLFVTQSSACQSCSAWGLIPRWVLQNYFVNTGWNCDDVMFTFVGSTSILMPSLRVNSKSPRPVSKYIVSNALIASLGSIKESHLTGVPPNLHARSICVFCCTKHSDMGLGGHPLQ